MKTIDFESRWKSDPLMDGKTIGNVPIFPN